MAEVGRRPLSPLGERFAQGSPEALNDAKHIVTHRDRFTSGRNALGRQWPSCSPGDTSPSRVAGPGVECLQQRSRQRVDMPSNGPGWSLDNRLSTVSPQ